MGLSYSGSDREFLAKSVHSGFRDDSQAKPANPDCWTLEKRADFPPICSWHYSVVMIAKKKSDARDFDPEQQQKQF